MDLVTPERGLLLRREDYQAMADHVAREAPIEACGLVAGQGRRSCGVFPVPNLLQSPTRFRMEPEAQWRAMKTMLDQGLDILAIYHSHPSGPPRPSAVDEREMAYPNAVYLIWAPLGAVWLCRAFRWTSQGFTEAPLHVA